MEVDTIVEKQFRHSFPDGSINATTRDNKLVRFECYRGSGSYTSLKEHGLISFIMQNWDDVKEVWEAIKAEVTKS